MEGTVSAEQALAPASDDSEKCRIGRYELLHVLTKRACADAPAALLQRVHSGRLILAS
jgi:hypothetical protein